MKPFECKGCGSCCKSFGLDGNSHLPLYFFEVEQIKAHASEYNLDLDVRPIIAFKDNVSGKSFGIIYGMFNTPCPYHNKNRCSIYHNRPFVCRTFPVFWTPMTVPDNCFGIHCFGKCENFDNNLFLDALTKRPYTLKGQSRFMQRIYKKCYIHCKNSNLINLYLTKLLHDLESKGKISLKILKDKELNDSNLMSLDDFLIDNKLMKKSFIDTFKKKCLKKRDGLIKQGID